MLPKKALRAVLLAGLGLLGLYLTSLFYDHILVQSGLIERIFKNHHDHPLPYYISKLRAYLLYEMAFLLLGVYLWMVNELNLKKIIATVRGYFEVKTHPLNLAVFRIVFFLTMIYLTEIPRCLWFSRFPAELLFPPSGLGWLLPHVPIDPPLAGAAAYLFLFFCFTGAVGLFSRSSAWLACLSGLYLLGIPQFYGKVSHHHHLLWFAAILGSSPCGDALSFDAVIRVWKQTSRGMFKPAEASRTYNIPLRFIWLLFGVLYFFPGFWKLMAGPAWSLGDNFKYMLYSEWVELKGWTPFFRIDRYPLLCQASAFAGIFFELSFLFLIFSDRLRKLAVWSGIIFHNITYLLMRISFNSLQTLYVAFFDWHSIFGKLGRRLFKEEMFLLYDGNCRLCRGTIGSLRVLDILGRVTYVNAMDSREIKDHGLDWLPSQDLLVDMHAVAGRRVWKGYASYRALTSRIPFFWPLVPLFWFLPVAWVGRKIYRRVADTRACAIPAKITTTPAERINIRPVSFVAVFLLAANIFCGFGRIELGWPFACYPTFAYGWGPEKSSLAIDTVASGGRSTPAELGGLIDKFSPERFWGLQSRILALKDENEKKERLTAFWKVCAENDPELRKFSAVRFYREALTTDPERRHENPLRRELLYEINVGEIKT